MVDPVGVNLFVQTLWREEIVPELIEYVRIPAKSPHFDAAWAEHGFIDAAVEHVGRWAREKLASLPGSTLDVVRAEGRTPVILIEVPGEVDDTVLLYGHLDKQPEMAGWDAGRGPWIPVLEGDKLYGRGAADDGYAIYGSLAALLALKAQGVATARCVVLIEACEESGSYDLPFYVDRLADRIGSPSLVVCLDSGCGNYDQLWLTTSLRGLAGGVLTVEVLSEGVHSGDASGVVPDSFRVLRALLSRIEDEATGETRLPELAAAIPPDRIEQARVAARALGEEVWTRFPFAPGMRPAAEDPVEAILARTWKAKLAVVGAAGLPAPENAGNVLRPSTAAKISVRLPPTADADAATAALAQALTEDAPYGATVRFEVEQAGAGWNAPALSAWLAEAIEQASQATFGREAALMGEGGTIPFIGMLGARFPDAQFVITGVLGPHSNAHGPNEFLHIPTGEKVTAAIALVLAAHAARRGCVGGDDRAP